MIKIDNDVKKKLLVLGLDKYKNEYDGAYDWALAAGEKTEDYEFVIEKKESGISLRFGTPHNWRFPQELFTVCECDTESKVLNALINLVLEPNQIGLDIYDVFHNISDSELFRSTECSLDKEWKNEFLQWAEDEIYEYKGKNKILMVSGDTSLFDVGQIRDIIINNDADSCDLIVAFKYMDEIENHIQISVWINQQ